MPTFVTKSCCINCSDVSMKLCHQHYGLHCFSDLAKSRANVSMAANVKDTRLKPVLQIFD